MVELAKILDQTDRHCFGSDPDLFVIDRGASARYAQRICVDCPAIDPCRQYAVERPTMVGIWGGTTWDERQDIRGGQS